MSIKLETPDADTSSIEIDDIVITDEDVIDVQLRNRQDVGH